MKRKRKKEQKTFKDHYTAICDIYYKQRCPSCRQKKKTVVYRYKNSIWKKNLVEICSCEPCLKKYIDNVKSLDENPERDNLLNILEIMYSKFEL